ncbi:hypothetical protein TeGR_g2779, partial [Tetraparma gracilis]
MPPFQHRLQLAVLASLTAFMLGVGSLKAAGYLPHPLSRTAGSLELAGALCVVRSWVAPQRHDRAVQFAADFIDYD